MKTGKLKECANAMVIAEIQLRRTMKKIKSREDVLFKSLSNPPVKKFDFETTEYSEQKKSVKNFLKFTDSQLSNLYEKKEALKDQYNRYKNLLHSYCENYNCDIKNDCNYKKRNFKYTKILCNYDEVISAINENKNVYLYSQDVFGMGVAMRQAQQPEYGMSYKRIYKKHNVYYIAKTKETLIFNRLFFFENMDYTYLIK